MCTLARVINNDAFQMKTTTTISIPATNGRTYACAHVLTCLKRKLNTVLTLIQYRCAPKSFTWSSHVFIPPSDVCTVILLTLHILAVCRRSSLSFEVSFETHCKIVIACLDQFEFLFCGFGNFLISCHHVKQSVCPGVYGMPELVRLFSLGHYQMISQARSFNSVVELAVLRGISSLGNLNELHPQCYDFKFFNMHVKTLPIIFETSKSLFFILSCRN